MEKYNLDVNKRYKENELLVKKSYNRLKKRIGGKIFRTLDLYGDVDNKYFIAKQIHDSIFDESILGIDFKLELSLSYFNLMNSLIANEYKTILTLENKVEELERDLKFYKKMYEINNNITV